MTQDACGLARPHNMQNHGVLKITVDLTLGPRGQDLMEMLGMEPISIRTSLCSTCQPKQTGILLIAPGVLLSLQATLAVGHSKPPQESVTTPISEV
jgi:hypothetical protein